MLLQAGTDAPAVERAVRGYGPEIRRLMGAVLQDEARVQDAFGLFCEGLVKGLPRFRWESSLRTWLPWPEVVRRMAASGEVLSREERARRATALRQQFQRVKARLRAMALQEGLVSREDMPSL